MDYSSERNQGCRILEYTHRGYKFISMENELLKLSIFVDKGADIYEIIYKPMDIDFMWKTPNGIREAGKYIPTAYNAECSYLDNLHGGWQELLPAGGPDTYKGAQLGLHGEVCTMPWRYFIIEDTIDLISVEFSCRTVRMPFYIRKRISLSRNSSILGFEEWLTNEGEEDLEFLWAQHPAFGSPFIDENCRIDIPALEFSTSDFFQSDSAYFNPKHIGKWPIDIGKKNITVDLRIIPPANKPNSDIYYLKGMEKGWFAITNSSLELGFGLCWDISVFPYATYWQACKGNFGYPWYGRTYNLSFEIWNSYTDRIRTAQENKTIKTIKARETINTSYKAVVYTGLQKVKYISPNGIVE